MTPLRLVRLSLALGAAATVAPLPAQAPPTGRITRDLRIDAIEHDLAPIGWLSVASDGTIIVSQPQDTELRFFDSSGRSLGTFGRAGGGPGEFRHIALRGWIGDTLWVTDPVQRRSTFIGLDRKLVRTEPQHMSVQLEGNAIDSLYTTLGVIPRSHLPRGHSIVMVFEPMGTRPPSWPGASSTGSPLLHVDPNGAFLNVAGTSPESSCQVRYPLRGGHGSVGIPFCGGPRIDVAPDGHLLANVVVEEQSARQNVYRVTVTRPTGDTVFSRTYAGPSVAVPRELATERLARISRQPNPFPGANEAIDKALEGVKVPPVFPPYSRLLVGRDETIWIELYRRDEPRIWQVLDAQGNPVGRVNVPWSVEIQVASRTTIWGVETDDDGLEHVVRYRVSR